MRKSVKKIVIAIIVPVFFVAALACCCFGNTAQAAEEMPSCHSTQEAGANTPTDESNGCECMYKDDMLAQKTFSSFGIEIVNEKSSIPLQLGLQYRLDFDAFLNMLPNRPPGFIGTVPLYILDSNLRI